MFAGSSPAATLPNSRLASLRAVSGVHGAPCVPEREPALATLGATVEHEIDYGVAFLPSRAESCDGRVPNDLAWLECLDVTDADAFSHVSTLG